MRILQVSLIVVAALLGATIGLLLGRSGGMSDEAFQARVRTALVEDPYILADAFDSLEQQQRAAEIAALEEAITRNYNLIESAPATFVGGNPNGDVTIIEFFDYECGYCRRALEPFNELIAEDGNIRVLYFELPILSERSYQAALAALAADEQGRYIEFHDLATAQPGQLTNDVILDLAAQAGLDIDQFTEDLQNPEYETRVRANIQLAQALTIGSTPTYIVAGRPVLGFREEQVREYIEDARNR